MPLVRRIALLLAFAVHAAPAVAGTGDLDPGFGAGGIVITDIGPAFGASGVVVQPDGRIVVVGSDALFGNHDDIVVMRHFPDGTLDASFGTGGIVVTDVNEIGLADVALQPDGKLLVAGNHRVAFGVDEGLLVRYLPDGALDAGFGVNGIVSTPALFRVNAVALRADGSIVASATVSIPGFGFALARFEPDGDLDGSFGTGGIVAYPGLLAGASAVRVLPDDRILGGGPSLGGAAALRFLPDGTFDPTFATGGLAQTSLPSGAYTPVVAFPADGGVVVGGDVFVTPDDHDAVLVRYDASGVLDASFGDGGVRFLDLGQEIVDRDILYGLAVEPDGRLVGVGSTSPGFDQPARPMVFRLEPDGDLDPTFGAVGTTSPPVAGSAYLFDVVEQADGRIVAAGGASGDFFVARLDGLCPALPDGDGDGIGDACDPCTNGGVMERAALKIARLATPEGDDVLRLRGRFDVGPGIHPPTTGVRVRLESAAGVPLVDVVVPPGEVDPATEAGWRVNLPTQSRFTYKNKGSVLAFLDGIATVAVKQNVLLQTSMSVKGKLGSYAFDPLDPPRAMTFVLDAPRGEDGHCATVTFADDDCSYDPVAGKLACRR